jgi:opacity protein-like surface antigen
MKLKKYWVLGAALVGFAVCTSSAEAQSRAKNKVGFGVGIISDPVPSILSYQVKYNTAPWLQLMASYGSIKAAGTVGEGGVASGSVTSYGASARAFLLPTWSLSPYVGAGYSFSKISGNFTMGGESINSTQDKLNVIVASAGIDHQAFVGFNIGAGINYVISPAVISDAIQMIPHFYFGWFFF